MASSQSDNRIALADAYNTAEQHLLALLRQVIAIDSRYFWVSILRARPQPGTEPSGTIRTVTIEVEYAEEEADMLLDSELNHEYLGLLLTDLIDQHSLAEKAFSRLPIRPVSDHRVEIPFPRNGGGEARNTAIIATGPSHCEAALRISSRLLHFATIAETEPLSSWSTEQMTLLGQCLPVERRSQACEILSDHVSIELRCTLRLSLDANLSVLTESESSESIGGGDAAFVNGAFRWNGGDYKMERLPFRLLEYMWDRESADAVIAHQRALENPLRPSSEDGIKAALRRINAVLNRANCPRCLSKSGDSLIWND